MNILNNKDKVIKLLKEKKHLRDDDNKLMANIWFSEIKDKNLTSMQFLEYYATGRISNPQSVLRLRRKLQEEFPELRGEKWHERHQEQENVKKQLYETPELYQGGTP